jgi:hypothetical protein
VATGSLGLISPEKSPKLVWYKQKWVQLMAALVLGLALAGGNESPPQNTAPESTDQGLDESDVQALAQAEIDKAVSEAVAANEREQVAERRDLRKSLRKQAKEKRKTAVKTAVAAALRKERSLVETQQPETQTFTETGTDPRFSYCYEANDAGYGNYRQGVDPEYDWYDDADGDGSVCEF